MPFEVILRMFFDFYNINQGVIIVRSISLRHYLLIKNLRKNKQTCDISLQNVDAINLILKLVIYQLAEMLNPLYMDSLPEHSYHRTILSLKGNLIRQQT